MCVGSAKCGAPSPEQQWGCLLVKKIELEPDTGGILMHLFSRRPPLPASKQTPASEETGVCIELVAGARYEVQQMSVGRKTDVVRVRFKVRGGALVPVGA